jgi:cyanate permease
MRAIWVNVLSLWALFAVIAFLAWTRQQPVPAGSPSSVVPGTVIVKGKNGTSRVVVVPQSATHATTRTSPVPAG